MFNASPKTYLVAFLIFCVFSSKNIIIYNEETLVTLSFFLFVLFVFQYFGKTLKDSLDERGEGIKIECQNLLQYKEQSLEQLSLEHRNIAHLQPALSQLTQFTKNNVQQLALLGKQSVESLFSQQMIQKFGQLSVSTLSQKLTNALAKNQTSAVLVHCALGAKGVAGAQGATTQSLAWNNLSTALLKNAIALVVSATSKK